MKGRIVVVSIIVISLGLAPSAVAQSEVGNAPEWTAAALPDGLVGLELHDVVAGGPGFIAAGGGFREGAETSESLVLTSADGTTWEAVALTDTAAQGQMRAIVSVGGQWFMGVGGQCCPDTAAEWVSVDGLAWQRLDSPRFFSSMMTDVTFTSAGFLAVGCLANLECVGGQVFQSEDGATWTTANPFLWLPNAVVAVPTGYVAVGQLDVSPGRPVGSTSADGIDWEPAALPDTGGALSGLIVVEDGLMAAGYLRDLDTMAATGLLMTSADGKEWSAVDAAALPDALYEELAVVGDSTILVGVRQQSDGRTTPSAWWLSAGADPVEVALGPGDGWARSVAVGADGTTLVAVGAAFGGAGSQPAVWVSQVPG